MKNLSSELPTWSDTDTFSHAVAHIRHEDLIGNMQPSLPTKQVSRAGIFIARLCLMTY